MEKIALITGASRGIGAATARLAAKHGWAVAVNYLANDAAAQGPGRLCGPIAALYRPIHAPYLPKQRSIQHGTVC